MECTAVLNKNSTVILAYFNSIGQANDLYLLLFLLMYANGKMLMFKAKYKVMLMFWNGVGIGLAGLIL